MVSVVVPCYNAEPYVAETIESVLQQSYRVTSLPVAWTRVVRDFCKSAP